MLNTMSGTLWAPSKLKLLLQMDEWPSLAKACQDTVRTGQ